MKLRIGRAALNAILTGVLGATFACIAVGVALAKDVYVPTYIRPSDGKLVMGHYRSAPDGNFWNNWSTKPNVNPYTGTRGTRSYPSLPSYRSYSSYPSYNSYSRPSYPSYAYPRARSNSQSFTPSYKVRDYSSYPTYKVPDYSSYPSYKVPDYSSYPSYGTRDDSDDDDEDEPEDDGGR